MSGFEPNSLPLREVLIFCFYLLSALWPATQNRSNTIRRNGHSIKRDTTKLSSSMTMISHMSQDRSRDSWKRWNGRSYPTRRTLQTFLLPTTICFDQCHTAWLIRISAIMNKSKNGSIRRSPQKTHRFSKWYPTIARKVEKCSG